METLAPNPNSAINRLYVFPHTMVFVPGFSLVFIAGWGGTATVLGQFLGKYKTLIGQVGGMVIFMFGLATLDVIGLLLITTYLGHLSGDALRNME